MAGKNSKQPPPVNAALLIGGVLDIRSVSYYGINLAAALMDMGVKALLFSGKGPLLEQARHVGVEPHHLESIDRTFPEMGWFNRAVSKAGEAGVKVVHALTPSELALAVKFGKALHVPVFVTVHDYHTERPSGRIRDSRVKGVIAVSETVREDVVNHLRVPKDIVRVIPTGVDVANITPRLRRPREKDAVFAVGSIGSLTEVKGHRFFLDAVRVLMDRGFHIKAVIVGEGPEKKRLHARANELELGDAIHFIEPRTSNAPVFNALDLFVMPSLREGLGQTVLEAMAYGVPVAATGVGGLYSVVQHERTGLIVPQKNAAALANAVIRIIDDPPFAAALSGRARLFVEKNFSTALVAKQTLALYESKINA